MIFNVFNHILCEFSAFNPQILNFQNRISRPMGRQLPPIRNHPYVPRREDPGTVSWEAALLAAKRAVNGREGW